MNVAQFDRMLAALTVADPEARRCATEAITDVYSDLDEDQATVFAQRLMTLRMCETDPDCQEAQLNAMGVLKGWFLLSKSVFQPLISLRTEVLGSQDQYLRELLDDEA
jgi:hypothetical protein